MLLMTFTDSMLIHLYGIIPGKYFDIKMELPQDSTLEAVERRIVEEYREEISEQYITPEGLLNHSCIVVVNKDGRSIDGATELKGVEEIWFIIPVAGG